MKNMITDDTFYENLTPFNLSEGSKKEFRNNIMVTFNNFIEFGLIRDTLELPHLAFKAKRFLADNLVISSNTTNKQWGKVSVYQKGILVASCDNSKGEEVCILWFCKKLFEKYPELLE